ncbi:hypothetical protein [Pseudomonas sp. DR48]|uniref:hypothetical protein n=1 Tax=Pseudomonas sp. DR48 TaxID=2871095 RepID=UPI001C99A052|nr:hypothetical protein [Pseudomonas sp. DR48]QZP31037.1 hypothetical protein K5K95_22955 [Pseudomonas sp. DR48]
MLHNISLTLMGFCFCGNFWWATQAALTLSPMNLGALEAYLKTDRDFLPTDMGGAAGNG